jgi:hypothetical protein
MEKYLFSQMYESRYSPRYRFLSEDFQKVENTQRNFALFLYTASIERERSTDGTSTVDGYSNHLHRNRHSYEWHADGRGE